MTNATLKNLKQRLALATTFALALSLSVYGGNPVTKFSWQATRSTAERFPIKMLSGRFIAPDGYSLDIPKEKVFEDGWGKINSTYEGGLDLKSLPSRMEIEFFSYTENVFYKGEFDLPYDMIVRLFREGYYSPKEKGHTTYNKIMAGVAPGGSIAVWLLGVNKKTEVFYGKAKKAEDIPWMRMPNSSSVTREEHIRWTLGSDYINEIKQNGIPFELWDSYRLHYPWQPVIVADQPPPRINAIFYFNGEEDSFRYPLNEATASALRPVPRRIRYIWDGPDGGTEYPRFNFDKAEMFAVFKKLSPDGLTPLKLEFHTRKVDGIRKYTAQLSTEKETVVLQKMTMSGSDMQVDIDLLTRHRATIKEQNLASRIDEGIASESYQVIRISDPRGHNIHGELVDFERGIRRIEQADIIEVIQRYMEDPWYDDERCVRGDREKYRVSQHDPVKLESALNYLNSQEEPFVFTSHYGDQYSSPEPDLTDRSNNLMIVDFVTQYKEHDWSPYLLVGDLIPTQRVGSAKYSFDINNEKISFRSMVEKKIWSLKNRYMNYATMYSTRNGKDKAPLLIEVSSASEGYFDDGSYLIIPK